VEAADESGAVAWGVGLDPNILTASLRAVVSAASRLELRGKPSPPVGEVAGGKSSPLVGEVAGKAGRRG
jgi:hypothetical protein